MHLGKAQKKCCNKNKFNRLQHLTVVEAAANHIWSNMTTGYTGVIIMDKNMAVEIRECWERYRRDEIGLDGVERMAHLAFPILEQRMSVKY